MKFKASNINVEIEIDDEDTELVFSHNLKWYASFSKIIGKITYVSCRSCITKEKTTLAILLTKCPKNLEPDHIDRNTLNNKKSNLRLVPHRVNMHNITPRFGSSQFTGVSFDKERNKWQAKIRLNTKKRIFLGRFDTELEASEAFNQAYKERELLNLPA